MKGSPPGKAPQDYSIGTPDITSGGGSIITGKGSSAHYSGSGVQKLWVTNGGDPATAAMAEAVVRAESGGSSTVTSANPDGGTNVGLFQLDTKGVGSGHSVDELKDPNLNTQITIMATNNGRDWSEWGDPITSQLPNHQYTPGSPVP